MSGTTLMHSIHQTRTILKRERLQEQQIPAPLGVSETAEWCNSFITVPKPNRKVCLCLAAARHNQALIKPIHREPILNDIHPKLTNTWHMTIIDNRFIRLPFGVVPVDDMFQWKINENFKGLPNVFGQAVDIFIVGYDADSRDHDRTLRQVMQICNSENVKLNRNKCHFRCTKIPFLEEVISREVVQANWRKHLYTNRNASLLTKKEF